jgi:phosphoenolpyruvate carboxylase
MAHALARVGRRVSRDRLAISPAQVVPVLTAHPTEAQAAIDREIEIAQLLAERDLTAHARGTGARRGGPSPRGPDAWQTNSARKPPCRA